MALLLSSFSTNFPFGFYYFLRKRMPRSVEFLAKAGRLRADRLLTNMGLCTRKNAAHWMRQHHLTESGVRVKFVFLLLLLFF